MTFCCKAIKAYKFLCVKFLITDSISLSQIFRFSIPSFGHFSHFCHLSPLNLSKALLFFSFSSSPSSCLFWNGQSPLGKSAPEARITFSGFMSASRSRPHNSSLLQQTVMQLNKFYILVFLVILSRELFQINLSANLWEKELQTFLESAIFKLATFHKYS